MILKIITLDPRAEDGFGCRSKRRDGYYLNIYNSFVVPRHICLDIHKPTRVLLPM